MNNSCNDEEELNEWYRNIGYNITWDRRYRGLTQEALAELVAISRTHLAAIEAPNSSRRPSMDLLFRIAQKLNVSPDTLMKSHMVSKDGTENR